MDKSLLPNHIAIIPDGNRRWAKEKGLPTFEGHRRGAETTFKIARKVREMGISTLTFWAFSTENWNRSKEEVESIIGLHRLLKKHVDEAVRDNVKITHIGRKDRMGKDLFKAIADAEDRTKNNNKYFLNLAFDYGGRDEVIRAIHRIQESNTPLSEINEENFSQFLDTAPLPHANPDIIIRTGGEIRTSGLMIWQATYAEYFFLEKYYPDFTEEDIEKIVAEYGKRQRRFGK